MCLLNTGNYSLMFLCLFWAKSCAICDANPIIVSENKNLLIEEVPNGETVTLSCRSNDDKHNFLYWHDLGRNIIVGPANKEYNAGKFNYEVLSGNLTIRSVSKNDEGLYNCVSRGVKNDEYNIRSVRMVVTKDWEEVYEHDPGVNMFRIVIVIGSLMVLAGVGYVAYTIWKNRYRNPSYLLPSEDEEDDDSAEEIFRAPGATTSSRTGGNIVISNSTESFGEPGISTDFKSILDNRNNK